MTVSGGNGRIFSHFLSAWIDQIKSVTPHQHSAMANADVLKGAVAAQPTSPSSGPPQGFSKKSKTPNSAVSLGLESIECSTWAEFVSIGGL